MRRVVVTGVGAVSSIGPTIPTVLDSLQTGRSGLRHLPEMAELGFRCTVYGGVRDFDPDRLDRRARQTLSPAGQYAMAAAFEALADAGLEPDNLPATRTAIVVGSMVGGINEATRIERIAREQHRPKRAGATGVVKMMNSTAASNIAASLHTHGRTYSVSSACSTGADSIGHAFELIAHSLQDVAVCGSTEEDIWKQCGTSMENWGGTPGEFNERPEAACRPYDRDRNGLVLAAGAGALLLEELGRAEKRGARVYGEIVGYGSANDGSDMFHPSGAGSAVAACQALQQAAQAGVESVDYINTHGTATRVGDEVEIAWLKDVFQHRVPPLSSTKGQTGHAQGAAGALEAVYCLLMMEHGFLAPTANLEHVDPACDGVPHVRVIRESPVRSVLTVNAGLGGTNGSLVFRKI